MLIILEQLIVRLVTRYLRCIQSVMIIGVAIQIFILHTDTGALR